MNAPDAIRLTTREESLTVAAFTAMASPCEILLHTRDAGLAEQLARAAAREVWRIEAKFSRYRPDSVLTRLNTARGAPVEVDPETAQLLDFAAQCHHLSGGMFDITSGVLRQAWRFDGSDRLPEPEAVAALLPRVGFGKLRWVNPRLTLPDGMELDFGGIGKEYAADRALMAIERLSDIPALVNLGGDLCCNRAPEGHPWRIGVERPDSDQAAALVLEIPAGALATSGDTHRYLLRDGIRYSHILDPFTGYPVPDAPRSVTVAAPRCIEAGMLATFALLQGAGAETFLAAQGVPHWCLR